jgi:hypothetical protein
VALQLTNETETIKPDDGTARRLERWYFTRMMSRETKQTKQWPVTVYSQLLAVLSRHPVILDKGARTALDVRPSADFGSEVGPILSLLREGGYRVIEQRFPRRAYIVIHPRESQRYL